MTLPDPADLVPGLDRWKDLPAAQQPQWPDREALDAVLGTLSTVPPIVAPAEVDTLRDQLADVAQGRAFLLQGGDCAETFDLNTEPHLQATTRTMLQMAVVLTYGASVPVVKVGRVAGQYAKPRSADLETRDGLTLPSYRGDLVNAAEFNAASRRPDPQRLLQGHARSAMTMNFVRALVDGGFADLHHPEYWNLAWVEHSPLAEEYRHIVEGIGDAVRFMETLAGEPIASFQRAEFYTSHEALVLDYEQALTRHVPRQWGWFDLSAHFPWIGMRTADLDGAHVEFCRGIRNPVAVKVGPAMGAEQLKKLIEVLNPDDEPGRLTLIHRMGAGGIGQHLPTLIEATKSTGRRVLWCCDPMHGNTETLENGTKTRRFANIRSELEQAFDIHAAAGSHLGGVHLELTGEDVTECMGGARDLSESDLARAYKTSVDPRLNYEQSLELAMLIVRKSGNQAIAL
ncbi:MAG TPA: 3-deoxy-7-phosphoheptulonate synthase class II [Rhodanobacteraceae bacterium]|nr:3-deoxy-7-phosphoheptulonate synthase class II [Rhodanobacteraceae bacterium]